MTNSKTFKRIVIGLLLVVIVAFIIVELACRAPTDRWYMPASSDDRETSSAEGYYIESYSPIKRSFAIPYSTDTIIVDSAWSEHSWTVKTTFGLCVCEHKIKGDSYNFCMPFTTKNSDINTYPFELSQLKKETEPFYDPGSYSNNRFNIESSALEDTVKIIISPRQIDTVITTPFSDTIIYVRAKNR